MYSSPALQQASTLHGNSDVEVDVALCFALPTDGTAPEWVQLLPAGKRVEGYDGRAWINDNPQAVVDLFDSLNRAGRGLPFDWEHSTELKAPNGDEAPASAWGAEMELREDGTIWARPEWTERGRNSISSKEYKYLSPVLIYKKSTGHIIGIKSVGLTNQPNLNLTALNRESSPLSNSNIKETPMSKAILIALGLNESASDEAALQAISALKGDLVTANNRAQNPDLSLFAPKADLDLALNRATTAEQKLADIETASLDEDIETAINQAVKDKKIAPSAVEYHTANCRAEGGLDKFKTYLDTAPAIMGDSTLDGKKPHEDKDVALNSEQREISDIFGNSAEDLKKYG